MFEKLTKSDNLVEGKEDEVKMENVKGGFVIGPLPYPTPVDACFWDCVVQCVGDPIYGANELNLSLHFVYN
jgi:hypothetical protein